MMMLMTQDLTTSDHPLLQVPAAEHCERLLAAAEIAQLADVSLTELEEAEPGVRYVVGLRHHFGNFHHRFRP